MEKPVTTNETEAPRFLRVAQAAHRLGLPSSTVYDAVARGRLPHTKIGSTILIPIAALIALEDKALSD